MVPHQCVDVAQIATVQVPSIAISMPTARAVWMINRSVDPAHEAHNVLLQPSARRVAALEPSLRGTSAIHAVWTVSAPLGRAALDSPVMYVSAEPGLPMEVDVIRPLNFASKVRWAQSILVWLELPHVLQRAPRAHARQIPNVR